MPEVGKEDSCRERVKVELMDQRNGKHQTIGRDTEHTFRVIMVDLLCITPFYDKYLCEALMGKGQDVLLAAISFHLDPKYLTDGTVRKLPGLMDLVAKMAIRNRRVRRLLKSVEYAVNLVLLISRVRAKKPDVIHIQWLPLVGTVPIEAWFVRIIKLLKIPVVYTVHNVLPHDTGRQHEARFISLYRSMSCLVCHTIATKRRLVEEFNVLPNKVWVIPHGPMFHDTDRCPESAAREQLGYGADDVLVLYFGIIRPYKGVEFLLDAWPDIARKCSNGRLIIVGSGEESYLRCVREKIDMLNISSTVRTDFRFVSNEELVVYHQAADILVYPYEKIDQSGALLTGMTFGKPIVATRVGGFSDSLEEGKTAYLVEYSNVIELSGRLVDLIREPEQRRKMGDAVLERVKAGDGWGRAATETITCYADAVANT